LLNIDDLTYGQIKQLKSLFGNSESIQTSDGGLNSLIGKKVIVRTYSSGVHYGELVEKSGKEVILKNARRLWYWKTTNNGISLSEVANAGLHKDSKVCAPAEAFWIEAIEIIPCTKEAIANIEGQNVYKA
jgi:hypothetical protein